MNQAHGLLSLGQTYQRDTPSRKKAALMTEIIKSMIPFVFLVSFRTFKSIGAIHKLNLPAKHLGLGMTKPVNKESTLSTSQRILRGATMYFAIVFGAGFILGPIRVLWAVPRFGERNAELMETPIMLLVIVFAALGVKPLCDRRLLIALAIGVIALALMITAELSAVLRLRDLTLGEYLESRDPVSGTVYLLMLVVFALMPWFVARR